jgi:hypothetical protein
MILVLANDAWSEALFLVMHKYFCFFNWIFLWWLYRALLCKSEEIYPQNFLSTALGRRVWWCGVSFLLLILFMQESWFLPWFGSWYAISKVYLDPLLASMGSWCDVCDALAWAWSGAPGACSAPPQVACPAPPLCLAPLLACPAPPWCLACFLMHLILFKWPCLLALAAGLVWWWKFPPNAHLMSRVNGVSAAGYDCSQWCVWSVVWDTLMAVLLCWWCC